MPSVIKMSETDERNSVDRDEKKDAEEGSTTPAKSDKGEPKTPVKEAKMPSKADSKTPVKGDSKTPVKAENGISSPASEKKKGKEEKEAPIKAPAKKRAKTEVKEIKKEEDDESEKSEDEEDEDDEESPKRKSVPLLDAPLKVEGTRERKKVERFIPTSEPKTHSAVEIPEGKGTPIGEIEIIAENMQVYKAESLKNLHRIMFGRAGTNSVVKKNIRLFKGFDFDSSSDQAEKKKTALSKMRVGDLKTMLKVLDLEVSGPKEGLCERLFHFLSRPFDSGKKPKPKRPSRSSKSKVSKRSYAESDEEDSDDEEPKKKKKGKSPKQAASKKKVTKKAPTKKKTKTKKKKEESESEDESDVSEESEEDVDESDVEKEEPKPVEKKKETKKDSKKVVKEDKAKNGKSTNGKKEEKKIKVEADDEVGSDDVDDVENKIKSEPEDEKSEGAHSEENDSEVNSEEESKKPAKKRAGSRESPKKNTKANAKSSDSEDEPPNSKKTKQEAPSDDEIKAYIKRLLDDADLEEITMKKVCKNVFDHYPDIDISKKPFIKETVKEAYGIVWKAFERKNKTPVAVKKIYDAFRNPTDAQRTFREIAYLQEFRNHPNIVKLLNVHRANNNTDIYLVFEYVETDLHKCIKREKILQDIHKRFIIYQLLKALKYIHSGNVIHRDLKPPNILINSQCHCKIADFGLARSVAPNQNEDEPVLKAMLTDYIATRWYRAPEVLAASKTYSKSIDMWSVGCILGEMLLGKPLFPGSSTVNQLELIINTLGPVSPNDVDSVCSGYGSSLLKQAPPPSKVTSLSSLLPTVSADALDLLNRFLTLNPNHRITAADALEHSYVQMFSEPLGETSLGHSVILPVRDDVRLSIDYYRNKINDAISQNEERQARKIRSCSSDPCVNKKSLEPLLSNVYSTMQYENATSHKSTSKKRQAGYLHCLTNNLTAADIQPLKHPATHPPHRTSKLGHLKHSSDGEASLKSFKVKSKSKSLPPPTDSILPAMERTPNQAAFLKNLGKTYLTSIQEYASMTGISQAALAKSENKLNEKLLLPKTKSLSRAKSLCPVYRHPLEGKKSNVDENVAADRSQIKSCNFKRGVHVTSLQKNISSLPVQVSRKKMSSTVLYPYLNPAVTSFKLPADIQNYNLLLSKNGG